MGNALRNANGRISFLSLIFSNILNTSKITIHRKTFDHIIQYSKPCLIIRFKYITDHTKHAKRFEEYITQPLKSIERRSSLPAILNPPSPSTKSIQNPGKHLTELSVKIVNGFESLTIFAKSSILDIGRITNNTSRNQKWTAIN